MKSDKRRIRVIFHFPDLRQWHFRVDREATQFTELYLQVRISIERSEEEDERVEEDIQAVLS